MTTKKGIKQLIYLNMSFLGIQFVFSLSSSHVSRVLQFYDVTVEQLPLFWLLAPLSGLVLQPILGHLADHTWTRWGRRKPFIFLGAIGTALVLWAVPNANLFFGVFSANFILGLFVLLLYAAVNLTMDPSRALLADAIQNEEGSKAFAIQTFVTGIGAVIGAAFPYVFHHLFQYSKWMISDSVIEQVKWAFYFGAILMILSVGWTLFFASEKPFNSPTPTTNFWKSLGKYFITMPTVMRKLAWIQFFSWLAFFNMWVFATPAIAEHFFNQLGVKSFAYAKAADWVGILFAIYSAVSAVFALCIPKIVQIFGKVVTHTISLLIGAVGFLSIYWIVDYHWLVIAMLAIGIAWGSILSMPYAILVAFIPKQNTGAYMGIFNVFITLPQIVCGLVSGWVLSHVFHHQAIIMLYVSGFSLLIASLINYFLVRK